MAISACMYVWQCVCACVLCMCIHRFSSYQLLPLWSELVEQGLTDHLHGPHVLFQCMHHHTELRIPMMNRAGILHLFRQMPSESEKDMLNSRMPIAQWTSETVQRCDSTWKPGDTCPFLGCPVECPVHRESQKRIKVWPAHTWDAAQAEAKLSTHRLRPSSHESRFAQDLAARSTSVQSRYSGPILKAWTCWRPWVNTAQRTAIWLILIMHPGLQGLLTAKRGMTKYTHTTHTHHHLLVPQGFHDSQRQRSGVLKVGGNDNCWDQQIVWARAHAHAALHHRLAGQDLQNEKKCLAYLFTHAFPVRIRKTMFHV